MAFALSAWPGPLSAPPHRIAAHRLATSRRASRLTTYRRVPRASAADDAAAAIRAYTSRLQCGEDLGSEGGTAIATLVDGLAAGTVNPTAAGGLLTLMPPEQVSPGTLSSIAAMLRGRMRRAALSGPLLDIVGTGGDGLNTVNISTAAAIVAAAAGCRVAKSGNRSASSKSGSADVLESLGVALGDGDDALLARCVDNAGISFLFARNHHPALKAVAAPRRDLGLRTVFNVLGPLVHPVPAQRIVLGVYSPALVLSIAEALAGLGVERAWVVHCAGLDELCPVDDAIVAEVRDGAVIGGQRTVSTCVDGISRCTVEDLVGGDAEHNAQVIRKVFDGMQGPVTDAMLLNAGAGCVVYGLEETLDGGVRRARGAINDGAAKETLRKWADATTSVVV